MYLSTQREIPSNGKTRYRFEQSVSGSPAVASRRALPPGVTLKWGEAEHTNALALLYRKVYTTYPFPVFDKEGIRCLYTIARSSSAGMNRL